MILDDIFSKYSRWLYNRAEEMIMLNYDINTAEEYAYNPKGFLKTQGKEYSKSISKSYVQNKPNFYIPREGTMPIKKSLDYSSLNEVVSIREEYFDLEYIFLKKNDLGLVFKDSIFVFELDNDYQNLSELEIIPKYLYSGIFLSKSLKFFGCIDKVFAGKSEEKREVFTIIKKEEEKNLVEEIFFKKKLVISFNEEGSKEFFTIFNKSKMSKLYQ